MIIPGLGEVSNSVVILTLSGFTIFITTIVVLALGFASKCPRCKKWWKRATAHKEFIKDEIIFKNETINEPIYDKNGNHNGYIKRKSKVPYKREHYLTYYKCQNCGHHWSQPVYHDISA